MGFRNRNYELQALQRGGLQLLASPSADKRTLVFLAVQQQLEHDNKRPFSLSQKLNDAPYRYTRDTLWAALNAISANLDQGSPRLLFGTEDNYSGEGDFHDFVMSCLTGTVSAAISAITRSSRWPS